MKSRKRQTRSAWKWLALLPALLLLTALVSYFTWWPMPVEAAYVMDLEQEEAVLTIEEDRFGEETLALTRKPQSRLLEMRAQKAFEATPVVWTSSDPEVVRVDEEGRLKASGKGEALVTARWGGLEESCRVRVYYPLKGLELSREAVILQKRESFQLESAPLPLEAQLPAPVVYRSEDRDIATVDEKGMVEGRRVGTTRIIARSGEWESACQVTVLSAMTSIRLNTDRFTMNTGRSLQLRTAFYPKDTTDKRDQQWLSTDERVARVSDAGVVEALEPGQTQIITRVGDLEARCELTVLAPLQGIAFREETLRLLKEETGRLQLVPEPLNTTDILRPVFESSDPQIVSVDEEGEAKALGAGEAVITARAGGFTTSCRVIVRVPMEGIAIREGDQTLARGEGRQLSVAFYPEDTNDERELVWESSDPGVVRIDETGWAQVTGAGQAELTVRCGELSSTIQVRGIVPVSGIRLGQSRMDLLKEESGMLEAALEPADHTEEDVIYYYSSNPAVATVDGGGRIWAAGAGECVITASHGPYSASCTVQVTVPMTGIRLDQTSLEFLEGGGAQLQLAFEPWDTTDSRIIKWSSSDPSVASVDERGYVWGAGGGNCQITAQVGGFSAQAQVHVIPFIHVESVSLSAAEAFLGSWGETLALRAQVYPEGATNPWVSWSSSDPAVASVDANGLVRALGSGTAVITASAEGKSASCRITAQLPDPPKVVVLDAGHGGIFNGAVWDGRVEKQMNLTTAYACKAYLEANYSNVQVYLTRSGDAALASNLRDDLYNRAAFANSVGADVLLSLHYNASANHNDSGTIVYASFHPGVEAQSRHLAGLVAGRVASLGLINQGVSSRYYDEYSYDASQGDYYGIIRHCAGFGIPAVLVEHCCMDTDIAFVDSEEDLAAFGVQDALAIAEYLGLSHK